MSTRAALVAAFVANGLGGPSFLARLAERQRDLDLSDSTLGLTVLGMAFGALLASPLAGWAVHRFGSRPVTVSAGVGIGATLWLSAAAPNALGLFGALALLGAADAAMDIAMNANGAAYEALSERSVLHGLHAAWSLGALLAAGIAAGAAAAELSLGAHLVGVGALIAVLALVARPALVPVDPPTPPAGDAATGRRSRAVPGVLVLLGVATIAAAIIEGTAGDWSAVQADRLGLDTSLAPLGTAAFMGGMFVGRLVGDRRTDRHGSTYVLRRGMVLCTAGFAVGAAWGAPLPFLIGDAFAGAGVAAYFPLAFSASARVPGVPPGAGAAVVSLGARAGFLIEPVLVGSVSEALDLRAAFGVAAGVAAAIALAAPRITRPAGASG